MQYLVANYKTVRENSDFRIDGEFYHSTILNWLNLSKSLLEIAKRGVEMAIEKNEEEAGKWINSELGKLEIKI